MQEGAAGALEALALLPEAARDAVRVVLVAAVGALAGARQEALARRPSLLLLLPPP